MVEAVKCTLSKDELVFSIVELPLEENDSPNAKEALHTIRLSGGDATYCVCIPPAETLRGRFDFFAFTAARSKHSIWNNFHLRFLHLRDSNHAQYDDPNRVPATLRNAIRTQLEHAAEFPNPIMIVMVVKAWNFRWLKAQAAAGAPPGGDHTANGSTSPEDGDAERPDFPSKHPNSYTQGLLENGATPSFTADYGFVGTSHPYRSPFSRYSEWGSFYVENKARSANQNAFHTGTCDYCSLLRGESNPDGERLLLRYENEEYLLIWKENPIGRRQLTVVSARMKQTDKASAPHRLDLNAVDIRLIGRLVKSGLNGLEMEKIGGFPELIFDEEMLTARLAVYLNPLPGSGRSIEHLKWNCVMQKHIPLPVWTSSPWEIACDTEQNTDLCRISGAPFYALTLVNPRDEKLADTLFKIHERLNRLRKPYNLIAYTAENPDEAVDPEGPRPCFVLIPRNDETAPEIGQRIGGLELLSGVLLPDSAHLGAIDTVARDSAFRRATLRVEDALPLERDLRMTLGLPRAGLAVYPATAENGFIPHVDENRAIQNAAAAQDRWKKDLLRLQTGCNEQPDNNAGDKLIDNDVLVRITKCSISQADRRFLRRKREGKPDPEIILGHEGGGYVVDPGKRHELHPGQKVVLIPHRPCNECRFCRSSAGNLCEHMLHMGMEFDGGFARMLALPPSQTVPVDDDFPDDGLPLVEPLACVLHTLIRVKDRISPRGNHAIPAGVTEHPVTVFGAGSMGCLYAIALRRFWPGMPVLMIDPSEWRREYAQMMGIASRAEAAMPENTRSRISIVAANTLDAYRQSINTIANGGTVVACSGIDVDDLYGPDQRSNIEAMELHNIHRTEEVRTRMLSTSPSHTIIGSSGYNIHDVTRAACELQRHYREHYEKTQNVRICGLDSSVVHLRGRDEPMLLNDHRKAVETFLNPDGMHDPDDGGLVTRSHKVLITIP